MSKTDVLSRPGGLITKGGRWLTATGIVFVVLGMLAIIEPAVAGLAVALFVGWFLMVGGVAHAVGALGGGGVGRVAWQLIVATIYIVGGVYFVTHPLLGLGTLTLLLAAILLAEAVIEVIAYLANRGDGAGWRLVNAIVTLLLGGMIWRNWPSSSIWAIGTLVGVNLMITGFSRLMLGSAARRFAAA